MKMLCSVLGRRFTVTNAHDTALINALYSRDMAGPKLSIRHNELG